MARDIILAGLPRSGTTLTCFLLSQVPNTVALNEPFPMDGLVSQAGAQSRVEWLKQRFAETRASLRQTSTALCKAKDGAIVSNTFSATPSADGLRHGISTLQRVSFDIRDENFTLIAKHPNAFLVLLPVLCDRFECFATVRNPLAVLLSWNSTKASVQSGHVPVAEKLDDRLREGLEKIDSLLGRQQFILSHYFAVVRQFLGEARTVRYEDIILTRGASLSRIVPEARHLAQDLTNANANPAYDRATVTHIASRLLELPTDWAPFYTAADIETLAGTLLAGAEPARQPED